LIPIANTKKILKEAYMDIIGKFNLDGMKASNVTKKLNEVVTFFVYKIFQKKFKNI
jgi:hypothetical protein